MQHHIEKGSQRWTPPKDILSLLPPYFDEEILSRPDSGQLVSCLEAMYPGSSEYVKFVMSRLHAHYRQGGLTTLWESPGVVLPETVAEHTLVLFQQYQSLYGMNPGFDLAIPRNPVAALIVNHDAGEMFTGDLPRSVRMLEYEPFLAFMRSNLDRICTATGLTQDYVELLVTGLERGMLPDIPPHLDSYITEKLIPVFEHEFYSGQLEKMAKLMGNVQPHAVEWMTTLHAFENRERLMIELEEMPREPSEIRQQYIELARIVQLVRLFDIRAEFQTFTEHGAWDPEQYGGAVSAEELDVRSVQLSLTRIMEPALSLEWLLAQSTGDTELDAVQRDAALLVRTRVNSTFERAIESVALGQRGFWTPQIMEALLYRSIKLQEITVGQFSPRQMYAELGERDPEKGILPVWTRNRRTSGSSRFRVA